MHRLVLSPYWHAPRLFPNFRRTCRPFQKRTFQASSLVVRRAGIMPVHLGGSTTVNLTVIHFFCHAEKASCWQTRVANARGGQPNSHRLGLVGPGYPETLSGAQYLQHSAQKRTIHS